MDAICVFFLLSSLHRSRFVSVVFDFNDSLNDVAPVSPILLAVDVMRNEKSVLSINAFYVSFLNVLTTKIEFNECCVCFQCLTQ